MNTRGMDLAVEGQGGSSTCSFVAVMGIPQSGMTVHAAMLQELGVPIGRKEHLSSRYEDECFRKFNHRIAHFRNTSLSSRMRVAHRRDYVDIIRKHANPPLWGLKDPSLFELEMWSALDEALHETWDIVRVGIVVVHRRFRAVTQSIISRHVETMKKASPTFDDLEWSHAITPKQAIKRVVKDLSSLFRTLESVNYPVLHIEYENTVEKPEQTARDLAVFIGADESRIEKAASIVKPELRHF